MDEITKENLKVLKQLQSMPLEFKIQRTEERLEEWGPGYISASGGLGSTVLVDVMRKAVSKHKYSGYKYKKMVVFINTGLEYPSVRKMALSLSDKVLKPDMTFLQVIEQKGWPIYSKSISMAIRKLRTQNLSPEYRNKLLNGDERGNMGKLPEYAKKLLESDIPVSDECCTELKKKPATKFERESGLRVITGEMAEESVNRAMVWAHNGCNAFKLKRPKSMPLAIWTKQDLLEYVKYENLKYADDYGDIECPYGGMCYTTGEDRTGCMYCLFGIQKEDPSNNRFTRMAKNYPKQYDYIINKLGAGEIMDYLGINYKPYPEQLTLF